MAYKYNRKKTEEWSIEKFFSQKEIQSSVILPKEKFKLQQMWRNVFALNLKLSTNRWIIGGHDWHVFSYDYAVSLKGFKAETAYAELPPGNFWVIPSSEHFAYSCYAKIMPNMYDFLNCHSEIIDIYVSAHDFSWTMVFTHELEMGLGPYFARKEWQKSGSNYNSEDLSN